MVDVYDHDRIVGIALMKHFRELGRNAELDYMDHGICVWSDYRRSVWLQVKDCKVVAYTTTEQTVIDMTDPEMITKLELTVERLIGEQ